MDPRIQQMQQDLQQFRASKSGSPVPTTTPQVAAPSPTPAPATTTPSSGIRADLEGYRSQKRETGKAYKPEIPKEPGMLSQFVKGVFSAPTTMVARPFQAVAEGVDFIGDQPRVKRYEQEAARINAEGDRLVQELRAARAAGQDITEIRARLQANQDEFARLSKESEGAFDSNVDEVSSKVPLFGGLIAETPKNFGDVKKDVGRGIQTVALGTGAPIAGGVAFGVGSSLEQGNDLLSVETAFNAALGGAAGKVAALVGKPLLNAAGKVVGTITPQTLKDVAARGATAIQEFAKTHQIAGGILSKPSETIAKGFQKVDDVIEAPFRGGIGPKPGGFMEREYPHLNPTKHYQKVNANDIKAPTTINEPKYAKATRVYNDAQKRGINLEEVANKRGIIHDKIAEGGRYNTLDTVDDIRQGNYDVSDRLARPAIKAAEPGVPLVPVKNVRSAMIDRVNKIPNSQITPEDRAWMIKQINQRYADGSAAAGANPNGYSLTSLHDNRIISQKNGGYKMGQSASDARKAQLSREEGRVFADIFDKTIPDEVGMGAFRKELEQNFLLADYLETLHNKAVPANVTKKAVRLFGKAMAATVGGKIGGFPGAILGSQYGDMAFSAFQTLPNPIKMRVLEKIRIEDPKAFKDILEYIGKEEAARILRPLLPGAGSSSFKPQQPTMFTTPGGVSTPNRGEAFDLGAVESGAAKVPKDGRSPQLIKRLIEYVQENNQGPYVPADELPVIKSGRVPKKPKGLNDILID